MVSSQRRHAGDQRPRSRRIQRRAQWGRASASAAASRSPRSKSSFAVSSDASWRARTDSDEATSARGSRSSIRPMCASAVARAAEAAPRWISSDPLSRNPSSAATRAPRTPLARLARPRQRPDWPGRARVSSVALGILSAGQRPRFVGDDGEVSAVSSLPHRGRRLATCALSLRQGMREHARRKFHRFVAGSADAGWLPSSAGRCRCAASFGASGGFPCEPDRLREAPLATRVLIAGPGPQINPEVPLIPSKTPAHPQSAQQQGPVRARRLRAAPR